MSPRHPSSDDVLPGRLRPADAGEVLTIQRAAYVTEAQAHADLQLPPLTQGLDDLREELARPSVHGWGIRDAGRLVAAVRFEIRDDVAHVGRLVVVPDRQGEGLGSGLLRHAEAHLPAGVRVIELFTGEHSHANLRLYRRLGYRDTHRTDVGRYALVHLRKQREGRDAGPRPP